MEKFNVRVLLEAVEYYTIEAENLQDAEKKAEEKLFARVFQNRVNYAMDFEEFNPADFE